MFFLPVFYTNAFCQQQRYLPGYLINSGGDTMNVVLQEEIRSELLLQVKYKRDVQSADISVAKAGEITGFGYTGGSIYKSISLQEDPSDSNSVKKYFAEHLLAGSYDLFVFTKKDRVVYVVNKENQYYQLTNTVYRASGQVDEPGNYQNQLLFLSVSCNIPQSEIERVRFDDNALIDFVTKLNRCANPGKAVVNYYHKEKSKVGAMAFIGGLPVNSSYQISAEIVARFSYPKINKNITFNIGVHYSRSPFIESDRTYGNILFQIKKTDVLISVPATIQYNFTAGIIQPYVNVGFAVGSFKETTVDYRGEVHNDRITIAGVGEIGLEIKLVPFLLIKGGWRYESYIQHPAVGVAFKFN
jgi:hypothetical protein